MRSTSFRSGPARAAAVLAAGALALGLAPSPSASAGEVSGEQPRRFAQVEDPRGDAVAHPETTPEPGADRRLADLTRVRYRTPATTGGELRIVTRWNLLRDGSERGSARQVQSTIVQTGMARDVFEIRVNNVSDRVRLFYPTAPGAPGVAPEEASVERRFGRDGRVDVVLSTEWLDGRDEIFLYTNGYSGGLYDRTQSSGDLDVGSPR